MANNFLQNLSNKMNRFINIIKYGVEDEHEALALWFREGDDSLGRAEKLLHKDADGRIIIPDQELEAYEANLRNLSLMRPLATVKQFEDTDGNKEAIAGLCDLYGAVKIGEDELDMDDLLVVLMDSFARSVAYASDSAFFTGTGDHMPLGIVDTPDVPTVHANNKGRIVPDDLLSLIHALPPKYRARAAFFVNSRTELALRMLKDGKGQYLWQPNVQQGRPNTFVGYPIYNMESIYDIPSEEGRSAIAVLLGDPSHFIIEDLRKVTVTNLEPSESDEESGLVGFKIHVKVNGKLDTPKAFVTLTVTA
jgi:hypothetical protein